MYLVPVGSYRIKAEIESDINRRAHSHAACLHAHHGSASRARLNEMASDTDAECDVSTHLPANDIALAGPTCSPHLLKRRKARGVSSITNDRVDAERAALAAEGYSVSRQAPLISWGLILCCLLIFSIIVWQWRSTQISLNE